LAFGFNNFSQCNVPPLASGLGHLEIAAGEYQSVARIGPGGSPMVYCTAKTTSSGCVPAIGSSGLPSPSSGIGFLITADQVEPNELGLFFYGKTGQQAVPFQGGILCAKAPLVRTALQNSGGAQPCGGTFSLDFNAYIASGKDPALAAGATVAGQYWFRDPGFAPPDNTGLSDAIEFTISP
jgi:hypothetical protein